MVYYASKHGAGRKNTILAISDRKSFKSGGALSGGSGTGRTGKLTGDSLQRFYDDRAYTDYIVYSYDTPIAWHTTDGWHMPSDKYSVTTSNHQSLVREAIRYYETDAYKSV